MLAAMRAGVVDYLPKPVTGEAFRASLDRVRVGLAPGGKEATGRKQPGKLYAFYSAKGGAGTTTTATNFAVVLHRVTGKKTLLVDLDLELGEIALLLGVQPRFNFVDMVQNFHRMDAELLASYIERHSCGVHLLSAPYHPDKAEIVTGDEIRRILQFLRKHYDYVVVDTSKSFSPATLAAIEQADLAFIVTNVDLASLRNLQRGLPLLKKMLGRGDDHIRLVVNRYHSDNDITLEDVARTLGMPVFRTLSNDYEGVSRSITTGKPIVLNGNSKFSQDMKALGAQVAGLGGKKAGTGGRLSSLTAPLGKLFGRGKGKEETQK
jgi:pilus assembly protein CpaE